MNKLPEMPNTSYWQFYWLAAWKILINLSPQQTGRKPIVLIGFLDENQWFISLNHISLLTLFYVWWNNNK